jgi:hypothetical protein
VAVDDGDGQRAPFTVALDFCTDRNLHTRIRVSGLPSMNESDVNVMSRPAIEQLMKETQTTHCKHSYHNIDSQGSGDHYFQSRISVQSIIAELRDWYRRDGKAPAHWKQQLLAHDARKNIICLIMYQWSDANYKRQCCIIRDIKSNKMLFL